MSGSPVWHRPTPQREEPTDLDELTFKPEIPFRVWVLLSVVEDPILPRPKGFPMDPHHWAAHPKRINPHPACRQNASTRQAPPLSGTIERLFEA
jgi:hypothetical protein